jgi:prepilin-type N-terminal cleavage/methylation domain-containing protein
MAEGEHGSRHDRGPLTYAVCANCFAIFQEDHMRKGFTLLELLVVIAIMAVLFGLTLAAVQNVRMASLRAKSMNNVRQINLAFQNYSSQKNELPTIHGDDARLPRPAPF